MHAHPQDAVSVKSNPFGTDRSRVCSAALWPIWKPINNGSFIAHQLGQMTAGSGNRAYDDLPRRPNSLKRALCFKNASTQPHGRRKLKPARQHLMLTMNLASASRQRQHAPCWFGQHQVSRHFAPWVWCKKVGGSNGDIDVACSRWSARKPRRRTKFPTPEASIKCSCSRAAG